MATRTGNSILNVKVAISFYCVNLVLQFVSRKIFLDYLGSEVMGLNTTAQNLLGFLNIAEMGLGTAVAYNLYSPLYHQDRKAIVDIVSVQGWLYKQVATFVIVGSIVLMVFFPVIFAKAEIPMWYTYTTFIAFLVSSLLGYYVNYRQIVLSADQKEYKITICTKGGMAIKVVAQIIAVLFLEHGYEAWIAIEIVSAIAISLMLNRTINKEYPWLHPDTRAGKALKNDYPQIIKKTKQVFFHKIGGFVLTQMSPLVIYGFTTLTLVAAYGNYMIIVMGISALMNALLNGIGASIGNLVAEGDKDRIMSGFWKVTFIRIWLASIICFCFYESGDDLITLWVGAEYILPHATFAVLIVNTFLTYTRTNDAFLAAYGLYQDIWAPLVEASLNIGFSIMLGYYWGITGVLLGATISLLTIISCWKPYFLFRYGFKEKLWEYVSRYAKYILLTLLSWWAAGYLCRLIISNASDTVVRWVYQTIVMALAYAFCSMTIFCIGDRYPRFYARWALQVLKSRL